MTTFQWIGLAVSVVLFVYLIVALVDAEKL